MKGMLASLDPHSQFMEPNDFKDMQDDTRSRFNGLGIEVAVKDGLLTVVTPMEDTPAAKAGILSGDQILKINGNSTEKMDCRMRSTSCVGARTKSHADDSASFDEGDQRLRARTDGDKSAERQRRQAARSGADWSVQDRLRPVGSIQRTDRGGAGESARRSAETGNAGAGARSAQQSRRTAEHRGRCSARNFCRPTRRSFPRRDAFLRNSTIIRRRARARSGRVFRSSFW